MFKNKINHQKYSVMSIFVVGLGVVGNAVYDFFIEHNIMCGGYDKYKNIGSMSDSLGFDMVIMCLPTPYDSNILSYDKSSIYEILTFLSDNKYDGLVIIKSTVEPGTCQTLADTFSLNIIHNPEFLSASTAAVDIRNHCQIIIGKTEQCDPILVEKYRKLCEKLWPSTISSISVCESGESESMKIFCNNFYAMKVQIFNEFYLLCKKQNISYERVRDLMLKNGWINPMHTVIPGTDGCLSYGGMCFPKDTNALLQHMKRLDTPHKVLENTIQERNEFRNDNINII